MVVWWLWPCTLFFRLLCCGVRASALETQEEVWVSSPQTFPPRLESPELYFEIGRLVYSPMRFLKKCSWLTWNGRTLGYQGPGQTYRYNGRWKNSFLTVPFHSVPLRLPGFNDYEQIFTLSEDGDLLLKRKACTSELYVSSSPVGHSYHTKSAESDGVAIGCMAIPWVAHRLLSVDGFSGDFHGIVWHTEKIKK